MGTLIGQYRIVDTIGAGGMGTVYLGEHTLIGRRAAIKVLRPELSKNRDIVERFFNEARAAAAINDPGIVQIFDFGFAEDSGAYIVMELLDGQSLASRLRTQGALSTYDALRVARQVASSIASAHAAGIIHRDLKPDNIFLIHDPEVVGGFRAKVLDFGIAKLGHVFEPATTAAGSFLGTPMYMAPEQFDGSVDVRSDIYSLGCVLFEILVGSPPFDGATLTQIIGAHANKRPPAPSSRGPSIPPDVDELVLRCLEKDPADRFPTMGALADSIATLLSGTRPVLDAGVTLGAPSSVGSGWIRAGGMGGPRATVMSDGRGETGSTPAGPHTGSYAAGRPSPARPTAGVGAPIQDPFATVFEEIVPVAFRDSLPFLIEFFRELFESAEGVEDMAIELGMPAIHDLASRAHYVIFLHDVEKDSAAPFGQIGTVAFRSQVDPLAELLAKLETPPGSVLITVLAAPQLGQGARETIFALRRERNLLVVPIAASEIRRACESGNARPLLINRIADLHTVSDPFAMFEGFTDPTQCIGFAAEVADLVKLITAGGKIVSVAGPPGSGKSSVVAMAEYGCDTTNVSRQFVRISCGELASHDPSRLIAEIDERIRRLSAAPATGPQAEPKPQPAAKPSEPPDLRETIVRLGVRSANTTPGVGPGRARRETGLAKRHQLVIVLEDADWLIRLASSSEPDAEQRQRARELWRGLAELCSIGAHTVIVTSIRDFQVMEQVPLERPVSVSRVPMRALNRRESDHLVVSLGELVGFKPTRGALARLHRESGGNVYALRLLCSNIIRSTRERPDYSPLTSIVVAGGHVSNAARHIAATGSTFRSHVSVWLADVERMVLQHVARERPRSARSVRGALKGSADGERVARALDGLELMNLVEHKRGRHRVCVPVFERWINTHLDTPPQRDRAIKQQRLSRVAIGCTSTALLLGFYWTWLRSTRSTEAGALGACRYELDHPDRIGLDETLELSVYQDCSPPIKKHDIAVEPVLSSLSALTTSSDCTATSTSCTTTVRATAGKQAHEQYRVRVRIDGSPILMATIAKDRFASVRSIGEKSLPAISFIPLLLGLIIAFHKDMKKYVTEFFNRGEDQATAKADEPAKPA